jgi:SAM-dependent methyltransferase
MKKKHNSDKALGHFDYETVVMGLKAGENSDGMRLFRTDVRLARLAETIPAQKGRIFDIGCGGGTITNALATRYPGATVSGCDVSTTAIALAKKYAGPRTSFGVIKNGKFPFADNSFDLCVCFDVLEHVPDIPTFLSETRRVLKKGGKVYFAIPCEGQPASLTWILQKIRIGDRLTYKHVGHIHPEFTHAYVKRLFTERHFTVISSTYSEHFITQCIRFIRFILPKEALELLLGTRHAEQYYDRAIVTEKSSSGRRGFWYVVRIAWLKFGLLFDLIERLEARMLKHTGWTAWKIFLYARKNTHT